MTIKGEEDLISVIITVYNVKEYLEQCIESVINQTYNNIEIIIVNDGSTDGSETILNYYKKVDSRITLISRENKGLLYSRIEGFNNAKGKYCTFVDSDDWLELNMIEVMYEKIKKYQVDMVRCDFWENVKGNKSLLKISNDDLLINEEDFEEEFYDILYYSAKCNSAWRSLFKKECLKDTKDIDNTITIGEDIVINLRIYCNINSILFIPDALYYYRKNPSSMTNAIEIDNIKGMIENVIKSHHELLKYVDIFKIKNKEKYKRAAKIKILSECSYRILKLINQTTMNNVFEVKKYIEQNVFKNSYLNEAIDGLTISDINKSENIKFKGLIKFVYKKNVMFIFLYCKIYYKFGSKIKKCIKLIAKHK